MRDYIFLVIAILLGVAIGALIVLYLHKPQIIDNPVPIYIPGKDSIVTVHHHYYHKVEQKAEVTNDTARTTVLGTYTTDEHDTLHHKTDIGYSLADSTFSVNQSFNLLKAKTFRVDTVKITVNTEVVRPYEWYEEPFTMYVLGIFTSILIWLITLL